MYDGGEPNSGPNFKSKRAKGIGQIGQICFYIVFFFIFTSNRNSFKQNKNVTRSVTTNSKGFTEENLIYFDRKFSYVSY